MKSRNWVGTVAFALVLCALALVSMMIGAHLRGVRHQAPHPRLLTAFLDVGTGDCTLILSPDGRAALIDAGPAAAGPNIAQALRRAGIRALDLLVLAAPTSGSIGGVPALLDNGIAVAQVWDNSVADTGQTRHAALQALRARHVPVRKARLGDKLALGTRGVMLAVLWPPARGARARTDALICRLDYGQTGLVLMGPADGIEEGYLVASAGPTLNCDVLQVAAGGADSATSLELLRRATPSLAIISSGLAAPPGMGTLHRLQAAGAGIWRTDTQGAITVFSDGRGPPVVTAARM